eukprot:2408270-Rhodomonas_salina.1
MLNRAVVDFRSRIQDEQCSTVTGRNVELKANLSGSKMLSRTKAPPPAPSAPQPASSTPSSRSITLDHKPQIPINTCLILHNRHAACRHQSTARPYVDPSSESRDTAPDLCTLSLIHI